MSKNKYIYGAVCKSQPVPNPGAELTENLPETKWRAAQKQSIKKANFLSFSDFCLSCNLNDAYAPLGGSHKFDS